MKHFQRIFSLAWASFWTSMAIAETVTELEPLVVTASRTAIQAQQAGATLTVVTREQLEQRQVQFVADILREVPGLAVSRSGGVGTLTQVRIRGAEANHTLVLIDGVEANDPASESEFDFDHLLAVDVERIEILRGPQSALWGSDALAGVINIVTRRGRGPTRIHGAVEGGSFATVQGHASVAGGDDQYQFALHGTYLDTGGINISRTGSEDDGYNNGTLSLTASVRPQQNLWFDLNARYTNATTESDDAEDDPSSEFFGLPVDTNTERDAQQTYVRAQARLDLYDGFWQQRLGVSITDTDNENFIDGENRGSNAGRKFKLDYQTSLIFETAPLIPANHTLTFAFEREEEDFRQRGAVFEFFGTRFDPNQDQGFTNYGYIGEYRLGLADQVFISGSVRHDDNDEFDNATTYRVTGAYVLPGWGTRFHGSYGTGIKNPTFLDRFGFFPKQFVGNPNLKPERSEGWDIGIEQPFWEDRFTVGVTYFEEKLEDDIFGFFCDPNLGCDPLTFVPLTAINLEGTSEREGVEVTVRMELFAGFSVTGAYTYVDSTEPDASSHQVREIRRPKHIASVIANYRFLDNRANLNLGIDYNGEQKDLDFSTLERVTLDDYTLVNVAGSYVVNKYLTVFARIENLFDDDYEEILGFRARGIGTFGGVRLNLGG
jgi:vitamin B12 transporter